MEHSEIKALIAKWGISITVLVSDYSETHLRNLTRENAWHVASGSKIRKQTAELIKNGTI